MSSQTQHLVIVCAVIAAVVILACVPGVREVFSQALSGLLGLLGLHTGHSIATNSDDGDDGAPAAAPALPSTLGAATPMPAAPMPAAPIGVPPSLEPVLPPEVEAQGVHFSISQGKLWLDGRVLGAAYSGAPGHINKPEDVALKAEGPLPPGQYKIGPAYVDPQKGPVVMALTPCGDQEMYSRGSLLIHGDSIAHPGTASRGCLICSRPYREAIRDCSTHVLTVTV